MAKYQTQIAKEDWVNDVAVPAPLQGLWDTMKAAAKEHAIAKAAFETAFNQLAWDSGLSHRRQFKFNYRFGNLSIAEVDREVAKTERTATPKGVSLLDYLRQNGDRRI